MTSTLEDPRVERAVDAGDDLATAVVETVADAADADPVELDPLYWSVDPDALDALLRPDVRVRFEYAGYAVAVTGGDRRRVAVADAEA